jgi:hypothetical protein
MIKDNNKELKFTTEDMIAFASQYMEGADEVSDKFWVQVIKDFTHNRDRNNAISEFIKQYDLANPNK